MNLKKYAENKKIKDNLKVRFDFIKEMESSIEEQYDAINNACEHDLILKLKSNTKCLIGHISECYTCLCCGKDFHKYSTCVENEFDIFLKTHSENMIDASEIVSEENIDVETWTQYELDTQGHVNVFVLRAQEKLNEIAANGENIKKEEIKSIILEDLKTYDSILKGRAKVKN